MSGYERPAEPVVKQLLGAAHADFGNLRERRETMQRRGMNRDYLPNDNILRAFALLGDHERDTVLSSLRGYWQDLQDKGLALGPIEQASTPEIRLLAQIRPHTEAIGTVQQQLQNAEELPTPPDGLWSCPAEIRGQWGQSARLHFSVRGGVDNILIEPDPIFSRRRELLAFDPNKSASGTITLPVDRGSTRITLLHRSGEMYRHWIQVDVDTQEKHDDIKT